MIRTTVSVVGMVCGMCEVHINEAVRGAFSVIKVSSSRKRKETVILSRTPLNHEALRNVITRAGYTPAAVDEEIYERKRLFRFSG